MKDAGVRAAVWISAYLRYIAKMSSATLSFLIGFALMIRISMFVVIIALNFILMYIGIKLDYGITDPGYHHVSPHDVNSYVRGDGIEVQGYWRGGTDGYIRSNPDGILENNLSQ